MMEKRIERLYTLFEERELDAILINKPENRRYFSGFTGSAGMLLVTKQSNQLVTDFRYLDQAVKQAHLYEIVKQESNGYDTVSTLIKKAEVIKVGFESDFLTFEDHAKFKLLVPQVQLIPVHLDGLRMIKDEFELSLLRKAVEIADNAFAYIITFIRPGLSEQAVAIELEHYMRRLGAEKPAFDTIVASGVRGALPHGKASSKIIQAGEFVTLDFGAVYEGYHSDMTRTICMGDATTKQRELYDIVLQAQLAGVQAAKPGLTGAQVDELSRDIIREAGYGDYFGHGLGHGIGLAIHEEPRISPTNTQVILRENMVVTVEPGIYLPDWGGIRIEDSIVIAPNGSEVMTASSKQLMHIEI